MIALFRRIRQWLASLLARAPTKLIVPKTFFGHMIPGYITPDAINISIGTLRTWDTGATWPWIAQGKWEGFDGQLALAAKLGAEVLYVFGHHRNLRIPDAMCIPGTMVPTPEAWTAFISAVVRRADGHIRAYEMWNEPAFTSDYWIGGDVPLMIERAKIGYGLLKQLNPSAIVLTPSFNELGTYGAAWCDEYLARGGALFADAIAFHSYGNRTLEDIAILKAIMAKHNVALPIWNTETVGVDSLEPQARLGIERVVLDSQIPGNEDWDSSTPLGLAWQNVYNQLTPTGVKK